MHLACSAGAAQDATWTLGHTNDGDDLLMLRDPGGTNEFRFVVRFSGHRKMKLIELRQGKLDQQRYAEYLRRG